MKVLSNTLRNETAPYEFVVAGFKPAFSAAVSHRPLPNSRCSFHCAIVIPSVESLNSA